MTCVICKEPVERGPICRVCRAEMLLTGEGTKVAMLDRMYAGAVMGHVGGILRDAVHTRSIRCQECGLEEPFDLMKKKNAYFCDLCGKTLLPCCAAHVVHADWGMMARVACRECRAEKALTGSPVKEAHEPLPGKEGA